MALLGEHYLNQTNLAHNLKDLQQRRVQQIVARAVVLQAHDDRGKQV